MPADIVAIAKQARAQLLVSERRAAADLVRAYGLAWERIQTQLASLQAQIDAARAAGESVNASWLFREGRLLALQAQIRNEVARFAALAGEVIEGQQVVAAALAARTAAAQLAGITGSFTRLPTAAVEALAGKLGDGSLVGYTLASFGPAAVQAASDALLVGVATGQGPRVIARALRDALGVSLSRALTIARTETLGAYRSASIATYKANRDVVRGWAWLSALQPRTCAVCWAMHGSEHALDEPFGSHPNCRCAPMPLLADEPNPLKRGAELFATLPSDQQYAVLGPTKWSLYRRGKLALDDLVVAHTDPRWGLSRREKTVKELES